MKLLATSIREAFIGVTCACSVALYASADSTPVHPPGLEKVGDCAITTIIGISARLAGTSAYDTGSVVVYANGVSGVSYEYVPTLHASRIGDEVKLCLVSILKNCPMSDDRGHEYQATNLRTGKHWASGYSSDYIREIAANYGVDPSAAVAIFNEETGGDSNLIGDMGSSFGPFQLHYGGMLPDVLRLNNSGLGDEFTAATGLNASDPSTWRAQIDFSLYKASTEGWAPWSKMSAAGLSKWSGIDRSQNAHDASQDYYQDSGSGRELAGSDAPSKDPNYAGSAAMPLWVYPTFSRLGGHPPACGAAQSATIESGLVNGAVSERPNALPRRE
nr:hypothetical protein [Methylocapsa sp. RX1]